MKKDKHVAKVKQLRHRRAMYTREHFSKTCLTVKDILMSWHTLQQVNLTKSSGESSVMENTVGDIRNSKLKLHLIIFLST